MWRFTRNSGMTEDPTKMEMISRQACRRGSRATAGYVVPLIQPEFANAVRNLGMLCFSCNDKKGRSIVEYRTKMLFETGTSTAAGGEIGLHLTAAGRLL